MGSHEKTFDWVQFKEGRARFNGNKRGWDERGYETYAVEIGGKVRYGEIDNSFLSNDNDYNIEIISFGYAMEGSVGIPNEPEEQKLLARGAYTQAELKVVQSLVSQLVRAGLSFENRPSLLRETPTSHFMGKILFREGWANVRQETLS